MPALRLDALPCDLHPRSNRRQGGSQAEVSELRRASHDVGKSDWSGFVAKCLLSIERRETNEKASARRFYFSVVCFVERSEATNDIRSEGCAASPCGGYIYLRHRRRAKPTRPAAPIPASTKEDGSGAAKTS